MTEPIASQYQDSQYEETAWQPTVYTSDSDAGDEKTAAAEYDAIYGGSYTTSSSSSSSSSDGSSNNASPVYVPTLSMAYTEVPSFVPEWDTDTSTSTSSKTVAPSDPFTVQLSELLSTEQSCLTATSTAVQDYQTLSSIVTAAIASPSLFGQIVGQQQRTEIPGKGGDQPAETFSYDKLDSEGQSFASSVNPQMEQLLTAIGNIIEAMGQFTALLNNAGQMYAVADDHSAFPTTVTDSPIPKLTG